jgi:hypothetical protein
MVFALLLLRCHYQGWEETVNASVTFLLKTTLAKTAKEGSSSLSGTTLEVGQTAMFKTLLELVNAVF